MILDVLTEQIILLPKAEIDTIKVLRLTEIARWLPLYYRKP